MEFKNRFAELRKEKKLAQDKLALELNVSKAAVSYWETGRSEPSLGMLKKIAKYFNVSTDYLIGLEDEIIT